MLVDDVVVGHAFLELEPSAEGIVTFVCVAQRCRARGYGIALMAYLEHAAGSRGLRRLRLECQPALEHFYMRCGFESSGSLTSEGELSMHKTLRV